MTRPVRGVGANDAAGSDDKVFALMTRHNRPWRHGISSIRWTAARSLSIESTGAGSANGEAAGTQRIAEILLSRVESALDERKFDAALQSLETAAASIRTMRD